MLFSQFQNRYKYHPLKALVVSKKKLKYYSKYGNKIKYRQQLKNTYFRNGACYAFSRKTILENSILPKSGYVISLSDQIFIDTYSDLILAKKILKIKFLIKFVKNFFHL